MRSELAESFGRRLYAVIGAKNYAAVLILNAGEALQGNHGVCHSHDFCDANMVMAEAFKKVVGVEMKTDSDEHTALWNAAWGWWRKNVGRAGGAS